MNCSMPGLPVHHQLPEFTQIHAHWVGDAIQPSHPLTSPSAPALNLSQHQSLFKWVSSSHQVPKYWSFSFNISPSNEHPGLISFRMDWLDLLAVQGTLKRLLQHHSSKASILQCSASFIVQPSHPYMTTGKTIPLTRQTFVWMWREAWHAVVHEVLKESDTTGRLNWTELTSIALTRRTFVGKVMSLLFNMLSWS